MLPNLIKSTSEYQVISFLLLNLDKIFAKLLLFLNIYCAFITILYLLTSNNIYKKKAFTLVCNVKFSCLNNAVILFI